MPSSTPPHLPPAGWYPDPEGTGQRWWDGGQWTQHVNPPTVPAAGHAPVEETSSGDRNRRSRRPPVRAVAAVVALILVGVAIYVAATSGGNSQAVYAECRSDVRPVLTAMQSLGSHLDVGVVQSDYAVEVGDVQAVYDRLVDRYLATACRPVVRALGEAMDAYARASSEWNDCIFSGEEGCAEAAVQELWSDADRSIATARQRLDSLTGGADAIAAAESEAAQVEADVLAKEQAHSALVAMETYATDHRGSYEGATEAKLRAIEPSLPPSLEVEEAGEDYFSVSVGSEGGNWFEIDREFGGELTFKCGDSGEAGCPVSGEWG